MLLRQHLSVHCPPGNLQQIHRSQLPGVSQRASLHLLCLLLVMSVYLFFPLKNLFFGCTMRYVGSLFSDQRLNWRYLQ